MNAERKSKRPSSIPITERRTAARLPAEHTDRLLIAVCETEPGQDPEDAIASILDIAAQIVPGVAFGVRVPVLDDGAADRSAAAGGADGASSDRPRRVIVVRRASFLIVPSSPATGPVFPELACESQHPIDFEPEAVLAVGSTDPEALRDAGVSPALVTRIALATGAALRIARQIVPLPASVRDGREQRKAAEKDKLAGLGRVVAGVVHELNNPVTSILAYAEYLRRKAERGPLDAADLERIARIEEAARRIHGFSRDLIAYARPSTELPVPLVIHDVVDRALTFCEHVLSPARVKVEREFGEVKPVRAIGGQLAQVFVNLFMNAAHAMRPHGGTLRIGTRLDADGAAVHVTVSDTGAGIAEHALPRIFEPFFTTNEGADGTGLGLSIVREIVEAHRGNVWAERRDGVGATFHVVLPVDGAEDGGQI